MNPQEPSSTDFKSAAYAVPPHPHIQDFYFRTRCVCQFRHSPIFGRGTKIRTWKSIKTTRFGFQLFINLQKKSFLNFLYILYHIFYKKSNKIFWLGGWDSNPHSQGQSLDSCGFRDRFLTIRIPPNIGRLKTFQSLTLYKYYNINFIKCQIVFMTKLLLLWQEW